MCRLRPELAEELGINQARFAAVGTHDTASAVAAIPGTGSFAFCSSGTWSLFGVETDEPILSDAVRDSNFSNEGTIQGGFRPLKNIMGLWMIQSVRHELDDKYSFAELCDMASKCDDFPSRVAANDDCFLAPKSMIAEIQRYCRDTNQPVPETPGELSVVIYKSLAQCYAQTAKEIEEITGIVNGTTNYMLTKMTEEGSEFDDVLKDAQAKGYAEKDPTADIEGYDACRKIAILTSLVCGQQVDFEDIHTEGITKITATDIRYAKAMGRAIKLLASSHKVGDGYVAMVAPFLLPATHPLYNVNDVFNAIFVHGNVLGDAMFYGSGAGKLPTASAVVADIVDMAKHLDTNIAVEWSSKKLELVDYRNVENRYFVRTTADAKRIEEVFGEVSYVTAEGVSGETGFVTARMSEADYEKKAAELGSVLQMIRVAQ